MTNHICKGADSDVVEGRDACYQAWTEHRDYWEAQSEEDGESPCAAINDFRCGFVHGFESALSAQLMRVQINGGPKVYTMKPEEALQAAATVADGFANEADALRDRLAQAEALLKDALEPGVFGMEDRSRISTREDGMVMELGNRIGFGALMDAASRMWAIKAREIGLPGSEFTCGPCAAVRSGWIDKAQAYLSEREGVGE